MDTKGNDATINRPHGERLLDAPVVRMDFPAAITRLKTEPAWEKGDRNAVTLLHTDRLRHVLTVMKSGARMPSFSVDGPLTVLVLLGKLQCRVGGESHDMGIGEAVSVRECKEMEIEATEECAFLLTLVDSREGTF
jgi:quercetin dioxygenase-like cupin family protein